MQGPRGNYRSGREQSEPPNRTFMEDRLPRKLAAILYADVAAYSRLTGEDKEGTHQRLATYLDLITEAIDRHGRIPHIERVDDSGYIPPDGRPNPPRQTTWLGESQRVGDFVFGDEIDSGPSINLRIARQPR